MSATGIVVAETLLFVRHASTRSDSGGNTIAGWQDDELTPEGRRDALRLGHQLGTFDFHRIWCSDLIRARETAMIVAAAQRTPVPIIPMQGLRSWNLGAFQGRRADEVSDAIAELLAKPEQSAPGGEPAATFLHRLLRAVQAIMAQLKVLSGPGLVVTHTRALLTIRGWVKAGARGFQLDPSVVSGGARIPTVGGFWMRTSRDGVALEDFTPTVEEPAIAKVLRALRHDVVKATRPGPEDPEWKLIHHVADAATPELRDQLLRAVAATLDATTQADVAAALRVGDVDAAIRAIPWDVVGQAAFAAELSAELARLTAEAGVAAAERLTTAGVRLAFNVTNPRAVTWAREQGAALVGEIGLETRQGIRAAMASAFEQGWAPEAAAQRLRAMLGLTSPQVRAVARYYDGLLAAGRPDAGVAADAYAAKLLDGRAMTIARTETIAAATHGQHEAWLQARDQGLLPSTTLVEWIITDDTRTCPEVCLPMRGQRVRLGTHFVTGDGRHILAPPAHPQCRCATGLVFE